MKASMRAVPIGSTVAALAAALAGASGVSAAPASASPTGTICQAVPEGAAFVVADASGVAIERAGGTERLNVPAFAAPPTIAVRGPDGTVWAQVPSSPTENVTTTAPAGADVGDGVPMDVFRIAPGATEAVRAATGGVRLLSAGWLDGRTAATIVDVIGERDDEEAYGAVLVDFADGEQRDIGPAGGIEYGVNSVTIGAGRVVEGAFADLSEAFSTSDAAGNRLEDWPSPVTPEEYAQPPLHVWPVAAIPSGATAPTWAWVEAPDWDMESEQMVGGWSVVVADAATGTESLRLDLGDPGGWLLHADFDGRFWVGTFADDPDPADSDTAPVHEPAARVLVIDTAAAEPAVADAGCAAGITATLDRNGSPAPPAAPTPTSTTAPATTAATTTTVPRCTYVEADDAYPLRKCDKGPAVRAIQEQINKRGQSIDADGYFGPATEQAVRNFQQAAGLEVDGLVGPDTWAALYTGDPAGTDADGNGTIEPWEVTAPAPPTGGDAASYVGLVFELQMPAGTIHTPDGSPIPGLENAGGWVLGLSDEPPFFGGQYVRAGERHMLWLTRADGRNPDGTLTPETVLAAIDVPVGPGQFVEFGECELDGTHDMTMAAVTDDVEVDGYRPAVRAWQFDPGAGTITEIDASRVRCYIVGD
jgi:hypothetical protein